MKKTARMGIRMEEELKDGIEGLAGSKVKAGWLARQWLWDRYEIEEKKRKRRKKRR